MNQFFKKKQWLSSQSNKKLKKTLGAFDLTMLGVGAVVGSGIFILPGEISSTITGPVSYTHLTLPTICSV